jgi:hypothetical protein
MVLEVLGEVHCRHAAGTDLTFEVITVGEGGGQVSVSQRELRMVDRLRIRPARRGS